ncbi:hypothetical protein PUN4_770062 [Paraburkholderia unamae]|uniref:hypothetical protein n=1 Tax=Paraburkholderia unamae TaxID=219649 RepID=UPI001CB1D99E|nr:hypothetical protein [Paraburkholderia unamae]CAG9273337.1 hypothetical protein PUN4_770062 [Paraburkholderia unamae]
MKKNGRPRFEPDETQREVVKALLCCGVRLEDCRLHVINPETNKPLSYNTFCRAFNDEIATGTARQNAAVAQNLYRIATSENCSAATVSACIFWLRCRAGWRFARDADAEASPPEEQRTYKNEAEVKQFIETILERYGRSCYERKPNNDGSDETPLH